MTFKKYIFFFFVFFSLLLHSESKLKVVFKLDDVFIFNNKILLKDSSNDIEKYLKQYDNSTDLLLKSNKFVYGRNSLDRINDFFNKFFSYFIERLTKLLEEKKSDILIVQEDNEDFDDRLLFIIKQYSEGEYNLIKNKPSEILVIINFFKKKEANERLVFKFTKKYKIETSIDYPTENLRAKGLIDKISSDIINKINSYYKNNVGKPEVNRKSFLDSDNLKEEKEKN